MSDIKFDIIARDKASSTFRNVGRSADTTGAKLAKLAHYGKIAALGLAGVTAAAAAFTYKVGSDYVNSLNQIQALTGANTKQMTAAAKALEKNSGLYAKMGQTTGDAASGVVELTKAGLSLHDALKSVNATMVLAKAGELSVADASTLVANSLNTFGLKAKDAGKLANYLANAANISSADVTDLAESFKYVSPVAAAAGVSVKETAAILAELSNSGIKASMAGTTLRTFLLNLEAPGKAAATALSDLNVQVFDAQGNMKPLPDLIGLLADKLNKLPAQQKAADMKAIFGKIGISGATAILKAGTDGLSQYEKGVTKAGAATKLANAKSQGLAGTIASLKAEAVSAAQKIYREYSPALNKRLKDFIQQFKDGKGAGGQFRDALDNVKKIAQELWPAMKKVASWTGTFLGYLASHKSALAVFVGAMVALKGASIAKSSGLFSIGKSVAGKALGTAAKGVVPVYVTNKGFGGPGGGGGDGFLGGKKGILGKTVGGLTVGGEALTVGGIVGILGSAAVATAVVGLSAYAINKMSKPGAVKVAGMTGAQNREYERQRINAMYPTAQIGSGIKATTTGLDSIKAHAAAASRSLDGIGAHAEQMSKQSVASVQALNNRSTGLDSVQAHAAAASRGVDQIGPHTQQATATGIAAIKNLDAYLAAKHEARIYANTSQAMTNIRVLQQQVDQLHGKTIIIRTTGGHVPGDLTGNGGHPYNPNAAPAPTPGTQPGSRSAGASGGSSKLAGFAAAGASRSSGFNATSGYIAGRDYMTGLLKGIVNRSMSVQAAIGKIASALSNAKATVSNLRGIRSGFRSTFGADSIFGQDFSHTATTTINGVGTDSTVPGTIADVLKFQRQQRNKARALNADVKKVTAMGLSKALVRQLEAQGASGAATLHALAQGDRSQIQQLNNLDKQTSASLRAAGMRAGNYVRGGSINADIRSAQKSELRLESMDRHLKDIADALKKGETAVINIDSETFIRAVIRRNHRKGVKTAGM